MTFRYFRTFILFFHYWVRRVSKSWVSFEYSDPNINRIALKNNKNLPSKLGHQTVDTKNKQIVRV